MAIVSFLGIRTRRFLAMRSLYAVGYGLPVIHETDTAIWFGLDGGSELHLYAIADDFHSFFGPGPVPGLLVDDFAATARRLDAARVTWLTELQASGGRQWRHYRAPDGNVYELMGPASI